MHTHTTLQTFPLHPIVALLSYDNIGGMNAEHSYYDKELFVLLNYLHTCMYIWCTIQHREQAVVINPWRVAQQGFQ